MKNYFENGRQHQFLKMEDDIIWFQRQPQKIMMQPKTIIIKTMGGHCSS
jgi:hypothetical protein